MRTKINTEQIALVFEDNALVRVLMAGTHWIGFNKEVEIHDITLPLTTSRNMSTLANNNLLENVIDFHTVEDHQIGLIFRNGLFFKFATTGMHAFFKENSNFSIEILDTTGVVEIKPKHARILVQPATLHLIRAYTVEAHEKAVMWIDGKLKGIVEPGTYHYFKNLSTIQFLKCDMRNQQIEITGQEILSKDKAALRINFFAQYRVVDISKVLLENKEADKQLYFMLQQALRAFTSSLTLDEILEKKEAASIAIQNQLSGAMTNLGYEITNCGIRDIILPGEMREIMNQVLIAEKKAQANIITRREESAALRTMLNNAKLIEQNDGLRILKEMESVERIAERIAHISLDSGAPLLNQMRGIFSTTK